MTQKEQVLAHLKSGRIITSVVASSLYGIGRLAAVIYSLKEAGYEIKAQRRRGVRSNYVEYSL